MNVLLRPRCSISPKPPITCTLPVRTSYRVQVRYMGHMYEAANSQPGTERAKPLTTWADLGLHTQVIDSLRKAFPTIQAPTEMQQKFIPTILAGKDVLLKDGTGSGKTFGLVLAALSRVQAARTGRMSVLFLVPHRDLAHQVSSWIEKLAGAPANAPDIPSLVQVIVRDQGRHLNDGLESLHGNCPKILVGTPQAIMDIYNHDATALRFAGLDTVIVDEVDYMIETVPTKDPNKSWYKATLKARKKLKRHPGVTRQLLDIIYARRKEFNAERREESASDRQARRLALSQGQGPRGDGPQLVMSSATLRRHLNQYLHNESGWLNKDYMAKVKTYEDGNAAPQRQVTHSIVIAPVGGQAIRNIEGAVHPKEEVEVMTPGAPVEACRFSEDTEVLMETAEEILDGNESPFNPNAMEAIATAFAIDVPTIALLVIPGSAAVRTAVYELRDMGINAQPLETARDEAGVADGVWSVNGPKLLVGTTATIRGLDLVDLSHIFVLGAPKLNGKGVDDYIHMAGRTGRFGRNGQVVTFVSSEKEAVRMSRILRVIGVIPVQFNIFQ